ncbi:AAA family ATPase [Novosphingobium sp. NDB2Meth1]|uniref:AAA family ATPase n=1 Tax=Novosphingobium sp. NDB2Meth1 TaxID=1892847 RepID=UPI000AD01995|nr:AAA family ATPase [Novosphingobium sp. NDB2Meth1]
MDDAVFRQYLNWKGAKAKDAQDTRINAVKKIESSLSVLGFPYADLDEAFAADRFAALREKLRTIRADAISGGESYRILMPVSENPKNRLAKWGTWLADYGRSLEWRDGEDEDEDERFAEGMDQLRKAFLAKIPDFEDFEIEEGEFFEQETAYKRAAAAEVLQALPLAGSPAANEPLEVNGRNVYKALSQSTGQGRPLGWRTPGEVAKAIPEAQTRFYETVAKLAQLEADDHAELEECARALEALHEEGITALKRGEVLCITISIFGTRNPNSACWFKARTFDKLGKLLFGRRLFRSSRFELQDFEEFQGLLHRMRSMLGEWGWKPSNLRDVQGFIWVALSEAEESETKDGLTREAVERSMDECEQIGVEAFLAKYQFGKPRDYWVRRESGGMLYPAKATVGAAYGFLPDGKPQSAKEFYGGFGEQAANGILQRLGFEIVTVKGTDVAEPQDRKVSPPSKPTNLILYGPPGTGKTYATAAEAVKLCGEEVPDDRDELMAVYRRLTDAKRIEFVTFHQSMSYEDFVEGKQPVTGADSEDTTGGFRLETFPGIFRRIARRAETSISSSEGPGAIRVAGRQVFKTSIGEAANPEDAYLFEEAIAEGHTLLGFEDIDWSDDKYASRDAIIEACREHGDREGDLNAQTGRVQMPFIFRNWVKPGDLIIVSKGNSLFRAIGEVTGEYEFHPRPEGDYAHRRKVRWLWVDREGVPVSEIYQRKFSMRTIYEMTPAELNIPALERYINSQQPTTKAAAHPDQFVLIIDEINRANISKVFGELITLLEPDKRLGQPNEIKVRLPHSEDEFGVPSNLHIIGTMNTADRSIALLDTALRRRFEFREMMPKPEVLNDAATRTGVDLSAVLRTLNERIEYLFDREHQIGHAYFVDCQTREDLDKRMRRRVIPLLAEYFFEDWTKVAMVLGDREGTRFLERIELKPPAGLDEDGDAPVRWRWMVRPSFPPDAYSGLM